MIKLIDETVKRDDSVSWEIYLEDYVEDFPHFMYSGEICVHHSSGTVSWLNTGVIFAIEEYARVIPIELTACKFVVVTEHC